MKKILSAILSVLMIVSIVLTCASAAYTPIEADENNISADYGMVRDQTFMLGDVFCDSSFNAIDSLTLKTVIAGTVTTEFVSEAGDFDADGRITPIDSFNIRLCLSGQSDLSKFDNGEQIYKLTIGGFDIAQFQIVIEEKCQYSDNEYMAAELFREYIKVTTGTELAIVRGSAASHGIYIHDVDKESTLGQKLGNEGFKYEVCDGDLHLYGTDRGNMYGAYEIIEKYLGMGFIDSSYSFVFKQRCVDIEEGTAVTIVPGYRFRQSKSTYNSNENFRAKFHLAHRINGNIGFDYDNANLPASYYGNFVGCPYIDIHSMHQYHQMATGTMPDESYGDLEARYYAKHASGEPKDETVWQPCANNEDQYQKLFTGLLEYIDFVTVAKNIPLLYEDGTHCFSFSLCDNMNWCTCRNCSKAARQSNYVDVYLRLKNRGAEDIQEYYPGLKLYTLMYDKECPIDVIPSEHLILVLGGTVCANHPMGSGEECHATGYYGLTTQEYEQFIDDMVAICAQSGAELWTWYYPDTFFWWHYDIPNIYTIFYDVKWHYEHGITGFYYEGNNLCPGYNFENLKAYMFSYVAFNPEMTLDEYNAEIQRYMYMVYGDGWEHIWEFLQMYVEAGNQAGHENGSTEDYCFIGGYDRAFDAVSIEYIAENHEYMRNLILSAIDEFDFEKGVGGEHRVDRLYRLLCVFDLLGLGATYVDKYLNGTEEERKLYEERYEWVYTYYRDSGMNFYVNKHTGTSMPATINYDTNPFLQFTAGSMRPHITAMLKGE